MAYLYTGDKGTKLIDIINKLGNKSYDFIECRCKYKDYDGIDQDDFFGACSYNGSTGELIPLDGDSYSLNDLYIKWEENYEDGKTILTVWEYGELNNN